MGGIKPRFWKSASFHQTFRMCPAGALLSFKFLIKFLAFLAKEMLSLLLVSYSTS